MLKWNDIVNFANHGNPTPVRKVVKTDQQWRELLNEEQYYQFFLNVLEVYGYAAVEMDNNIIKIIRNKDAKTAAIPVVGSGSNILGDEMVSFNWFLSDFIFPLILVLSSIEISGKNTFTI